MTVEEASSFLSGYRVYDWLTRDPQGRSMWSTIELLEGLQQSGLLPKASRRLVNRWCEATMPNGAPALPGAVNFRSTIGWRIPTEDLLIFFAEGRAAVIEA